MEKQHLKELLEKEGITEEEKYMYCCNCKYHNYIKGICNYVNRNSALILKTDKCFMYQTYKNELKE